MIDRDKELQLINQFIDSHYIEKCPTAFVCRTRQAEIPDRELVPNNVKRKNVFWKSKKSKYKV